MKKIRNFFRKSFPLSFFLLIYQMCGIGCGEDESPTGVKKVENFSKIAPHFQNHLPIYHVCGLTVGDVSRMASRKKAIFFGFFYRISFFLLIYRMCGIGCGRRMTRKSGDFFENLCRISLLSPDIPCVRNQPQDGMAA